MTSPRGIVLSLVPLLICLVGGARLLADDPPAAFDKPAAKGKGVDAPKPAADKPLITVSKETTVLTEPLRPDGYVDYLAAINQRQKSGVTTENNAAVLFWQALGPEPVGATIRDRFFEMMGIQPPPEKGQYFVDFAKYVRSRPEHQGRDPAKLDLLIELQLARTKSYAWTADKGKLVAQWLDANEQPLKLIVEGAKRPRRYEPLVPGDGDLMIYVLLPGVQSVRSVAEALLIRANLRLGEGKIDEAWNDLMTIRRIARLESDGERTLVENLVAIAADQLANQGDEILFRSGKLTAAQALKMKAELAQLGPASNMARSIDTVERYCFCDCVGDIAREGWVNAIDRLLTPSEKPSSFRQIVGRLVTNSVDWNVVLRFGNGFYDREVQAIGKDRQSRRQALRELDAEVKEMASDFRDAGALVKRALGKSPTAAVFEEIGRVLVALLMPALSNCVNAEDRSATAREIDQLGFALAAYHADHGDYPKALAELAPKYVAKIPDDVFSDKELIYRVVDDGYLLYSVGPNGQDDGGPEALGRLPQQDRQPSDDIGLRIGKPKSEAALRP